MKAVFYENFKGKIGLENLPDPAPNKDGVVIEVKASGLCRSDWHGWMGHDPDINLPHVPGHELAGEIVAVGKNVQHWKKGDRVTLPFCCGCGFCPECHSGNQQICDNHFQPGFTAWGSFAQFVAIRYADVNLVRLPEFMEYEEAAILGCRFVTSYRGIVAQGKVQPGDWVAVFACGGVGLSAIMIANAIGAKVIAIDISDEKLDFAKNVGASITLNARKNDSIPTTIQEITKGGAHVSVDALGSTETCIQSILSLRKRGKHIQIGLMAGEHSQAPIPMGAIISKELEIIGSHGMQAHQYPGLFHLIEAGKIQPAKLLGKQISLNAVPEILPQMNTFAETGVMVINQF